MMRGGARTALAMVALLAACTDQGPVSAPGSFTATLVSPYGAEGAAVVTLHGEGIGEATALGDVELFRTDGSGGTSFVLVSPGGGTLAFELQLADTTRLPETAVAQVAGPDDELRMGVAGYRLVLTP
jgi:hypothetical protein